MPRLVGGIEERAGEAVARQRDDLVAIEVKRIGDRAKALGIETVAFDRSGYRCHGRVQALADAAREAGLKF